MPLQPSVRARYYAGALLAALLASACRQDMHDQPKKKPQAASAFFSDHKSARNLVAGTIPYNPSDELHPRDNKWLQEDEFFYKGKLDNKFVESFPMPIDAQTLARGRERFNISCSPCHGRTGYGDGTVVARGMKRPPSFHIERLQKSAPGYFYDVITNGFGSMFDLADRVQPKDRWAIVAYVRALQESQNTKYDELSAQEKKLVADAAQAKAEAAAHAHDHAATGHEKN